MDLVQLENILRILVQNSIFGQILTVGTSKTKIRWAMFNNEKYSIQIKKYLTRKVDYYNLFVTSVTLCHDSC